jgi:hypothetical protein
MSFPEVVNMYNRDWERIQNPPRKPEFIEPAEYGPPNRPPRQPWEEVNRLMADFFYDRRFYDKRFYDGRLHDKK